MRNKEFKRLLAFLLIISTIFSVAGCSSEENTSVAVEETMEGIEQQTGTDEQIQSEKTETVDENNETNSSVESATVTNEIKDADVDSSKEDASKTTESVKIASITSDDTVSTTESVVNESNNKPAEVDENSSALTSVVSKENTTEYATQQEDPLTNDAKTAEQDSSANVSSIDTTLDDELRELAEMDSDELTPTQRNAINMLNYMTFLTQEINDSKQSRMYLDSAYNALIDNTYPNAVDAKTQTQITSMLDTLHQYQMISVKRERLEYIYEQNQAQALRQAMPNPVGLLSAVQSGNLLKAAASVLYMAVDSVTSYQSATSQTDLQYLKDGWELDDAEAEEVHKSRTAAFSYMMNMVRDNDLPGDYALTEETVEEFVTWKNKTNLVSKISWFESNYETYKEFGPYWLELAKDYFDSEDYKNCLDAFEKYEEVTTRILRKDKDYANDLPMAIIAAKETMSKTKYNAYAEKYAQVIIKNTDEWSTRYFVAQIYLDLYKNTKNKNYLDAAFDIVYDNVNELTEEQKTLNATYLAAVEEKKTEDDATKRQKEEVKQYNKMLKENRKVELPPVSEALYLNCDFLFALVDERGVSAKERNNIEAILHENGDNIFLTTALDNRFRFNDSKIAFEAKDLNVEFDGEELRVPASCVTNRSTVSIVISGASGTTTIDDWTVKSVERPKNSDDVSQFTVTYTSETAKKYKYSGGDSINISVIPVAESPEEVICFKYKVVPVKKLLVFNSIDFERE